MFVYKQSTCTTILYCRGKLNLLFFQSENDIDFSLKMICRIDKYLCNYKALWVEIFAPHSRVMRLIQESVNWVGLLFWTKDLINDLVLFTEEPLIRYLGRKSNEKVKYVDIISSHQLSISTFLLEFKNMKQNYFQRCFINLQSLW